MLDFFSEGLASNPLSLYIHYPFCSKKCSYCHFYVLKQQPHLENIWYEGFFNELSFWQEKLPVLNEVPSLYFGGGTPSKMELEKLSRIIESCQKWSLTPIKEVSFEVNPEDASISYLKELKSLGVNRLSIGIQTLDPEPLSFLDRVHNKDEALEAVKSACLVGFEEVSVDLILDLPGQSKAGVEKTLFELVDLPITHLSLYNLEVHPKTKMHRKISSFKKLQPDDKVAREHEERVFVLLEEADFIRYEISAFRRKKPSLHNLGYWRGRNYIGLGPSAHSYLEGVRFSNPANLKNWELGWRQSTIYSREEDFLSLEKLSTFERGRELFLMQLRILEEKYRFSEGKIELATPSQEELSFFVSQGWVKETPLSLTSEGAFFYDYIAQELVGIST